MIDRVPKRGPPYKHRDAIVAKAAEMKLAGGAVNKSRIARELRISLRTVFRTLPPSACI